MGPLKRFFVYAKVAAFCLVALAVVVLVVQNCNYQTRFWPGAVDRDVPTLWLILITSILSMIVFWILSKTRRVFVELAEIRAQRAEQKAQSERERRMQELDERERRIDDKIKQAIEEKSSEPGNADARN